MRTYIISLICSSKKWQEVICNGYGDELPMLEIESDEAVLEYYDYYVGGV